MYAVELGKAGLIEVHVLGQQSVRFSLDVVVDLGEWVVNLKNWKFNFRLYSLDQGPFYGSWSATYAAGVCLHSASSFDAVACPFCGIRWISWENVRIIRTEKCQNNHKNPVWESNFFRE